MTKLLHTRSKIFFPDPYVVRMEYSHDILWDEAAIDYRKVTRNAYKLIHGTWGYSALQSEQIKVKDENVRVCQPYPAFFNGINQVQIIGALFDVDWVQVSRGYLCFKDELDALQFRLSIDTRAMEVKMWPACWFTIHEVVETDES